jgi:multidrug efflux pump subunit AcrB
MDPRRVRQELSPLFEKLDLPPGYSVEFDPEAIRQANNLSVTVFSLILSIIFCYMIIASINESFIVPLIVLIVIPPSLSIPALCLALSNNAYNLAVACAFIAVSGMTVNASVLCVDGLRRKERIGNAISLLNIYSALRKKIPALLYTTATTIACALPFLFLKEEANTLIRTMSLVGVLGVTSSLLFSITVIPSLLIIFRKLSKNKNLSCLCGI